MHRLCGRVVSVFAGLAILLPIGMAGAQPYQHDRFGTQPMDIEREYSAFVVSFDGNDGGACLGVPEWVAYELRATPTSLGPAPDRPSRWFTDDTLHAQRIAPDDDSYRGSNYSRGHMCMKSHAHRVSDMADRETHTVLNACPQLQVMNAGVWLSLENLTGEWADRYGKVWIVTGPVFLPNRAREWIGDPGEVPVAVPDACFKIAIRDDNLRTEVRAFLIPMRGDETHGKQTADVRPFLTSVDIIEALTGLDFLTTLPDSIEDAIEQCVYTDLWEGTTTVLAERPPPSPDRRGVVPTTVPASPVSQREPVQPANTTAQVSLRSGITASPAETALATKIKAAGWEYTMPRPKSAQAAWGNTDGRTTWWNGYWRNSRTGQYSSRQPVESDGFAGDGVQNSGWRRGGSPGAPSRIEWLCSTSGGIPPR